MKTVGIREAKNQFSALVRAAVAGDPAVLTDHGKPVAAIVPYADEAAEAKQGAPTPSDAAAFRQALLAMPYEINIRL